MSLVLLCVPPNSYYYVLFFTKFPLTFNYHGAFISNSIWGVSLSINYPLYIDWYNSPAIGFHFRLIEECANKFFSHFSKVLEFMGQLFERLFNESMIRKLNESALLKKIAKNSYKLPINSKWHEFVWCWRDLSQEFLLGWVLKDVSCT